jgi:hypothetical protein
MFIHEMGHVFDNVMNLSQAYRDRIRRITTEGWTPMPSGCDGLIGINEGNCSDDEDYIEQTADMFLNWVDGTFTTDLASKRRANWSNLWIGTFVLHGPGSSPSNAGFGCDEDEDTGGAGCQPQ